MEKIRVLFPLLSMKLFGVLFCLFVVNQAAWGEMSVDLKRYYDCVNHAELAVIDSNYQQAIDHYESAFKCKNIPFLKDRYNLAVCYSIKKNYKGCCTQLEYLIDKGAPISSLRSKPEFNGFFDSKFGTKLTDYAKDHTGNYNIDYRSKIDSLVKMDQLFRNMDGKYEVYGDTIRRIDSLNVIALNRLIELYGFPSEDKIGINSDLETAKPPYSVLIIHQQHGAQGQFWDYSDLFRKALEDGEIEAHAAAEFIWKSSGKDELGVMDSGLIQLVIDSVANANSGSKNPKINRTDAPLGYFKMSAEKEAEINQSRNLSGLETLEEARKKTSYCQKDSRFVFPGSGVSVLVCWDQAQHDKMAQSIIWMQ